MSLHPHAAVRPLTTEPWALTDNHYQPQHLLLQETLLSLANGYIGSRGTLEEGAPAGIASCEGTYLNGVYSSEAIHYGESAYGFAKNNHKMLQVANGKLLQLSVDGDTFSAASAVSHSRVLDLQQGVLSRHSEWHSSSGKQLRIVSRRFVSQANPHLLAIELSITALNFSGQVELNSGLDAAYPGFCKKDDPRVGEMSIADSLTLLGQQFSDDNGLMLHRAKGAEFIVAAATSHQLPAGATLLMQDDSQSNKLTQQFALRLTQGETQTLHKLVIYCHSANVDESDSLGQQALQLLHNARQQGFAALLSEHQQWWQQYWQQADVSIDGDVALQQAMRFNLFSLTQSAGRNGQSNIGAKGLTGPGYDGHYFWDTEIYVVPVMSLTQPEIARQLLSQRYSQLDAARQRARQMSHSHGALYPWRTIGGEECSAYFPAGTAQYHINAAIAYAIRSYYLATDDWSFLQQMGGEMLVETSRLWLQLGFFSSRSGKFEIHMVTGPDEYSALVNNNFYTNAMVQLQLRFTLEVVSRLQAEQSPLLQQLGVTATEIQRWQQAADTMYLAFDEQLQVHPQDDSFLQRQPWDFANTPADKYPLLLHYHPLVIYRHQVLKQADVVLALLLLDDAIPQAQKQRDLAYYEPLTTHDSSLSSCIHSILFAETGDTARAHEFFGDSARMDLDNHHANTEFGVHIACMAGSWMSLIMGFAGVRSRRDGLYFNPQLPAQLPGLSFRLNYRGRVLQFSADRQHASYQLLSGEPLTVFHGNQPVQLTPAAAVNKTIGATL
ncbi:glycoside hydrolase family 65 protein [Rheinheimera muenzenbergensis]|uniref:Glycoside hydrolase family 65 protein n=1 Tax=Rheinheimera muenzenbergensis TaxID=1193628 RepID=A0ABU8C686_9GAMM